MMIDSRQNQKRWSRELSNILITGGAGFIGKRLALSLRSVGHTVAVFDNLQPQVHPEPEKTTAELKEAGVRFTFGDVLDIDAVTEAIVEAKAEIVVHLAAETGTGQSYDIPAHYCDVNVTGTARLIEAIRIARTKGVGMRRVVLAGSRAVYGEGACRDAEGREVTAVPRLSADLATGDFAPKDAQGRTLEPIASCAATTVPAPASIYASTKLMQEYLLRQGLEQSGIEATILRLQNVYGAGQSLHNPLPEYCRSSLNNCSRAKPLTFTRMVRSCVISFTFPMWSPRSIGCVTLNKCLKRRRTSAQAKVLRSWRLPRR